MSNCKMSLMILCVGSATLAYSASARAQPFEGCGVLGLTQPPEVCLEFFPDSGEFPLGLGRLTGVAWGNFQEGDHIHAAGLLVQCGGFCTDEGLCFDADSVIGVCTIPTVSEWGMIALALLVLTAGTLVIGRRRANPL